MMKKHIKSPIFFFLLIIGCMGCNKDFSSTYVLYNNTQDDLKIIFYSSVKNDTVSLNPNEKKEYLILTDSEPIGLSFEDNDSIAIIKSDMTYVYYKNSSGKNIYDTENNDVWVEKKVGKKSYEYTFEITDEDLQAYKQE